VAVRPAASLDHVNCSVAVARIRQRTSRATGGLTLDERGAGADPERRTAPHERLGAAYSAASGRDVAVLPYWKVLGCWKVAIIFDGIRRRRVERDEPGGGLDATTVDRLVTRATALAGEAGL
jgi:hypothetical protein